MNIAFQTPVQSAQEKSFREFTPDELDVGYNYAIDKCHTRVDYATLRKVGNHAGAIRKADPKKTVRKAAMEAMRAYEKRTKVRFNNVARFNAYIRSIAKMLSERNPDTKEKRSLERYREELEEVS